MIFDRTQADVDAAIEIRAKLQRGEAITNEETEALERGTLTINTINRIEEKQAELKTVFDSLGYRNTDGIENRAWGYEDFFRQEDFDRILRNLEILKNAYFVLTNTTIIPNTNYRQYGTINALEHILNDMSFIVDDMISNFRICGETECGND
jgi:hypothetical protein